MDGAAGFLIEIIDPTALDQRIKEICERLSGNAPVTMRVTKEAMRRLQHKDLVRACYATASMKASKHSSQNARRNGAGVKR
jgi:enoyl-CoA hydratase